VGAVAFAMVGDLWLRKVRGVTRPLPRALFFVPTTVAGLLTGFGFTSGLCINRLSELNSPLGASMRDMYPPVQSHPSSNSLLHEFSEMWR
jgi:hypothetical protein